MACIEIEAEVHTRLHDMTTLNFFPVASCTLYTIFFVSSAVCLHGLFTDLNSNLSVVTKSDSLDFNMKVTDKCDELIALLDSIVVSSTEANVKEN